jgi:hypothetical protein
MGPDEIPMIIFKECLGVLTPYLCHLFELIILKGRIPKVWKVARVKPIFKKGDKLCVENYWPISNLNSISKIF